MRPLAEIDGRRITVEVPGSSANLGAGYDCLAVAVAMTNRIQLEVRGWSRGEIELIVHGQGQGELTGDRENRFIRGVESALRAAHAELPEAVGWRVAMRNDIPLSRGLGSSAAATVAGPLARHAPAGGAPAGPGLLQTATPIQGHPGQAPGFP